MAVPTGFNTAPRRHDIDALRVLAFALLILYHAGMLYVAGWEFHIKSAYQAEWLQWPMRFLNQWRMPLLFLIAGVASSFLLERVGALRFAALRSIRLGLPLIVGMLLVVPPQPYLEALSNGSFEGSYLEFLSAYLSLREWPASAFSGAEYGMTWNHLWFLPYLLLYALLLAIIAPLLNTRWGSAVLLWLRKTRGPLLMIFPIIYFGVGRAWLDETYPQNYAVWGDWYAHWEFAGYFAVGALLGRDKGIWHEISRQRWATLSLATACFCLLIAVNQGWNQNGDWFAHIVGNLLVCANAWFWLLCILGWAFRLLNRPYAWLPYATEAVYPWYILHQTITIVLAYHLSKWPLGPVVEPVLLIFGTALGCVLIHEYLVRRWSWIRPLFGLKRRQEAMPESLVSRRHRRKPVEAQGQARA